MKFLQSLVDKFAGKPIDWDELEESLIRADLGVSMTTRIIKTLQDREAWSLMGISDVVRVVREEIARILPPDPPPIRPLPTKPKVILLLGVNGTGKTTSTETLLVVDATTGGNALSQAREFQNALGLTGLIVTKLDGSGKGGILVAIQDELGIPTRFVGTGEELGDFAPFDASEFVAEML